MKISITLSTCYVRGVLHARVCKREHLTPVNKIEKIIEILEITIKL